MRIRVLVFLLASFLCSRSSADFFNQMVDVVKSQANQAALTATTVVTAKATEALINMIINYSSEQTKTDQEVSREYEAKNGSLPDNTTVSSYQTEILPGASVSPGTRVTVKSVIAVVPGKNAATTKIEESLTIYDSEDTSVALKSMTKPAAQGSGRGGEFNSEFTFALPEGLPQGVYPIRSSLLLNGEVAGDTSHELQLVLNVDYSIEGDMVAVLEQVN
jgi:hypothetical protein